MQWTLDKYSRLADTRNMQLTIERGPFEQLFLQLDYPIKMLFVYHNGNQLEMFLLHPLAFPHDLVRRDQRILFCIKDQNDGNVSVKFRVRFSSPDSMNNFCATIGKFIGVKAFDDWNCRSSSPFSVDLNCSSVTNTNRPIKNGSNEASFVVDPDLSTSSVSLLNCFSQSSKFSSQDTSTFDISHTQAPEQKKLIDMSTQTVVDENTDPNQKSEAPPSSSSAHPSSSSSIHLHIENLFSSEAVHAFGGVLRQLANGNSKTETRGRKRKRGKGTKPPKRPLNSYMLWNTDGRKRSAKEWRELPAEEKEHWKLCAAVGRVRYNEQMETYKKSQQT
ncbi:hypothetical protein niasHS_014666 [Heterodera schachtii]|uniref:HMG box domain-containing protein n=1 Tax=Heterodera schachtii TaxID=97005 RepID=A0ABD2IF91_HETSC